MSTRDCSNQRIDRVDPRESRERPAEMPAVDRVNLLREGACINRYISSAAERFLPNVSFDQRSGGNYICVDNYYGGNGRDMSFDPRAARGLDPRYGGDPRDPRLMDPRNGGDPRLMDPRNGGDPRLMDPRNGGDPRLMDSRNGGDPRLMDPRNGGDPRLMDPRNGGDPRLMDPRNGGDPRLMDPRQRYDGPSNAPGDGQMRDYTVHKGDSLWKIARHALQESGQPAGARDIMNAIQSIVEANKAEHPSLAKNPNLILDGWHLKIPCGGGQDAANRDGRNRDLYGYGGDRRDNRGSDLYQYGGDRGGTRYDGGNAYFDQRDGAYRRPYGDQFGRRGPYDNNGQYERYQDPYRRQYECIPYDRNPYDRNPYDRSPYDQSPYQRDPYRNPYERPPGYQDSSNQPMNQLSMALKDAALMAARGMGTIGRCAAGVQVALARIGHSQFMGSGNAWDMGAKMANSGKFDVLPLSQAREGDVIVRSWNRGVINQHGGRNWGDIVVVTSRDGRGNMMGANDHHGRIPPDGGRYCNSYVLRCRA